MIKPIHRLLTSAAALCLLTAQSSPGETLLSDYFDNGNLATNPNGVGSGFSMIQSLGTANYAVENASGLTLYGAALIKNAQSNDSLDPTGTTSTWVITQIPGGFGNGVNIGWALPGGPGFTYQQPAGHIMLEIRSDRVVFDVWTTHDFNPQGRYVSINAGSTEEDAVFPGTFSSPITASIYLSATSWKIDVTDAAGTINIHQSGVYNTNLAVSDVLALSPDGKLRALAIAGREYQQATFRSVNITTPAIADLEVTNITTQNNQASQGSKVTVTATVKNSGDDAAPATVTSFYDGSTVIGTANTPAIPAGQSAQVSVNWRTATVKGARTIIATADSEEEVTESDETNNAAQLTVEVKGNQVR